MKNPRQEYEKGKEYYGQLLKKQNKSINLISNLRLIISLAGLISAIYFYLNKNYTLSSGAFLISTILFVYLIVRHNRVKRDKKYTTVLYEININSLKRLAGEWKTFHDTGEEFKDEHHNYAGDLDIFGKGSLFQWINTASTYLGRRKLKNMLTVSPKNLEEISKRQEAINELAPKLSWRQEFMAEGNIISHKSPDPEPLFSWANQKNGFYLKGWVSLTARLFSSITIIVVLLYLITSIVPYYIPLSLMGAQFLLLLFRRKERAKALNTVYQYKENIKTYEKLLKQFESEDFTSPYLNEFKKNLLNKEKISAHQQINTLEKIVDWIANRHNQLYFIINIITLWDYHVMIALENWKEKSGSSLKTWIDTVGEIEALSSLAIIRYDQPDWTMPKLLEGEPHYKAKDLAHPLLGDSRVCNDLQIDFPTRVLLITGSNMSGKSTLLRTAGINLVLAYAGAPVCAQELSCSLMIIYTCMRVSDNLEQSISSFYAELLRIKMIVEATKEKEQVFFLLDEIFKGTNSQDRHTGAKILIKNLSKEGALGMVSTHDLELGELERESNKEIMNYHFREYYKNDKIHFDYKLRLGVSTTRNALYLIKMAGIEFDE